MSGPSRIRLAEREDDASLCGLLQRVTMPGNMALAASYTPSFFSAIEVEGERPRVIVGEREGRLVGCGLVAERRVYLNGKPARVGYLSSLRLDPGIRNTNALARGYRYLRTLESQQPSPLPFYLSTIMGDNDRAAELLCSGRAGLPHYVRCGRYTTHVVAVNRQPRDDARGPYRIRTGADVGAETLCHMLNEWGSKRQFYPVYTPEDLRSATGLLRGLRPEHFFVACDPRDKPVGVLACWDQMPFRRYTVERYHGVLRGLYPLARLAGRLLNRALLPQAGRPVSCLHVACIAILNDEPQVFGSLLRRAQIRAAELGRDYLFVGLAEGDPLAETAQRLAHLRLQSGVYRVGWDLGTEAAGTLDDRPLYLELGSL